MRNGSWGRTECRAAQYRRVDRRPRLRSGRGPALRPGSEPGERLPRRRLEPGDGALRAQGLGALRAEPVADGSPGRVLLFLLRGEHWAPDAIADRGGAAH